MESSSYEQVEELANSSEEILFYYLKLRSRSNEQKIRQNTSR